MSDDESFLGRWSRRKRQARQAEEQKAKAKPSPPFKGEGEGPVPEAREGEAGLGEHSGIPHLTPTLPPPEDGKGVRGSLPSIESIEANSDISAFLAPGVPPSLTQAALRRAWSVDPEIRDFVGLSENAWDFNVPGGVPGFGSLGSEDVRRLASRLFAPAPDATGNAGVPPAPAKAESTDPPPIPKEHLPQEEIAAPQHEETQENPRKDHARRRHGGALPQ